MASSNGTGGSIPFRDLTNTINTINVGGHTTSNAQQPQLLDPKERKRQRDRDRYAQMSVERKEELLKKRREARQQKKVATISNVERHQPGQSALSELRYTPTSEGIASTQITILSVSIIFTYSN